MLYESPQPTVDDTYILSREYSSPTVGDAYILSRENDGEMKKSRAPPKYFMDIYIDDCVIVTASYATHVRALKRFLEACREERMYVNQKAILGCKSITYVGYSVSYDGVSADPDKVEAIQDMPDVLLNKKQVRIFLGKIMFFSSFVPAQH